MSDLRATYRLQLNAEFDFDDAAGVVPYLAGLGVSHLYLSPIWAARPGSSHGYDVVDHTRINPELGGREGFERLADTARDHGLGLILDCVPNHMGISWENPWWADVLSWGQASPFADYFDIDWHSPEPSLAGKVLLPILGDHYGRVLEDGNLKPGLDGGRFVVRYWEHTVPIHPRDGADLLDAALTAAKDAGEEGAADTLAQLAATARLLAKRRERVSRQRRRADRDRAAQLAERLATASAEDAAVARALEAGLSTFTPKSEGDADGKAADRLHRLLERQAYRLAFWRLASQEINYRRFFDINDLAGLRMEEPALFDAAHELVLELANAGRIAGVRLDHVDGLLDPQAYLARLRRHVRHAAPDFSIHVEKILGHDEHLRRDWPVEGTTGYEVMNLLHGIQVDPAAKRPLVHVYRSLTEAGGSFAAETVRAKMLIMGTSLTAELNVLANELNRIAKRSRFTRDYARQALRDALANVIAHFPVYRTYVNAKGADDADRAIVATAVHRARRAATTPDLSIYEFIESVLTTAAARAPLPGLRPAEIIRFACRIQQYTSPVTAKSVEDTSFYRWFPLVSLNEVGGEPEPFGTSLEAFHVANAERAAEWPRALVATATHDHKRGEDVRARLAVLSERPQAWSRAVRRWFRLAAPLQAATADGPAPSANDLYLFFQIVVGAWPLDLEPDDADGLTAFRQRLQGYMEKAVREAKLETSWAVVDEVYENAVADFVEAALDAEQSPRLLDEIVAFTRELMAPGVVNGLVQTTLKLTVPGVPDLYQGSEGWDLSLVDPDNRRAVDYAGLGDALRALERGRTTLDGTTRRWHDGRIKQALVARLLACRRHRPALFAAGDYRPLDLTGELADRVCAFARVHDGAALVVVVPRLTADRLADPINLGLDWGDTALDLRPLGVIGPWTDVLREAVLEGPDVHLAEHAMSPPLLVLASGS